MGSDQGWIKLHRQIMETPEWLAEPFTRGQAWVDLLLLANHETGFIRRRGIMVMVERGQVGYSVESLAERWKWSKGKALRFFQELTDRERICRKIAGTRENTAGSGILQRTIRKTVPKKSSVSILISLVNYERYQVNDTEDGTEDGPKTVLEQRIKRIKRINNMSESEKLDNSGFDIFYQKYPKHEGKKKAFDAWKKINPDTILQDTILKAIERQKQHKANLKARNAFCPEWPLPATWLNGRRWEDEILQETPSRSLSSTPAPGVEKCPRCGHRIVVESDLTPAGCVYCPKVENKIESFGNTLIEGFSKALQNVGERT